MSITNAQRHDLHSGLEEVLGAERAETLMDYLPPVGWADVATKRDLDVLHEQLRHEIGDVRHEIGDVRHDIGDVRTDLTLQMADLRTSLMRQQLLLAIALIGVLGTLMAIIRG